MSFCINASPLASAHAALAADRAQADPALWITRLPDADILAHAARLEQEGRGGRPLWGVPLVVKDNIDVAGLPTTAGCPGFRYLAERTAPAVQRLLDAGALLLGKTNLDQFATGLVGTRSPYGTPRNVFDPDRVPGGSSSGSAVAVAAGIARIALGTDTAGSGRVPAAFGNIVGIKPTLGSVSAVGVVPACRSLDTVSIFARSVDEGIAALRLIAGFDAADPYARQPPFAHLRRAALGDAVRLALPREWPEAGVELAQAVARACAPFATEEVSIATFLAVARLLYDGPWVAERAAALREIVQDRPDILHPVTRAILAAGLQRRTVDAFDAFHRVAQAKRAAEALFARVEALVLPTAPFCATLNQVEADPAGVNARLGTYTNFVNLLDLAAIAVPIGFDAAGLPMGAMVIGPAWSEGRLAAIADTLHRGCSETAGRNLALPPPAKPDPLTADETALFCVGAHMSGLQLNAQITRLGGRFLRHAHTRPLYRLHDLGDRPGLVLGAPGVQIAGEVWALPASAIGPLLSQVPAPLGFGWVELDHGPCLGFLAEATRAAACPDITVHGGWRAYLAARAHKEVA